MHTATARNHCSQRGTTLLEALIAFLVLTLGMLAVSRVQTQFRLNSELARQRSEAVRLAQQDIESLRGFSVLAASAGARSYDGIAVASHRVDSSAGYVSNTSYVVRREIETSSIAQAKSVSVTASWTDRTGGAQQIVLNSVISGSDPAYSGALTLAHAARTSGPLGRSPFIPLAAKDLGNGSSALKPVRDGSIALVFSNISGALIARCTGIAATTATRDLTSADLVACEIRAGLLLSGSVRFSSASPPDVLHANGPPPEVLVALTLSGGMYATAPACNAEAMKTVSYVAAGSLRIEAVPIAATAASEGMPAWVDSGDRHVAYHCAVYPLATGQWSGVATLVPSGWTIGAGPTDKRVCRIVNDLDGSGAIDANIEHPPSYAGVTRALANQNFLVINASESCPAGATAAHQP